MIMETKEIEFIKHSRCWAKVLYGFVAKEIEPAPQINGRSGTIVE